MDLEARCVHDLARCMYIIAFTKQIRYIYPLQTLIHEFSHFFRASLANEKEMLEFLPLKIKQSSFRATQQGPRCGVVSEKPALLMFSSHRLVPRDRNHTVAFFCAGGCSAPRLATPERVADPLPLSDPFPLSGPLSEEKGVSLDAGSVSQILSKQKWKVLSKQTPAKWNIQGLDGQLPLLSCFPA